MSLAFSLSGIAKRYPHFALQDITLDLPEGQVMGLVGVNGAGKTTLLRLLTGLAATDAGEVTVLGHRLPEHQVAAKRDIGFASEEMRLYRGQTLRWHMDLVRAIYPGWDEAYAAELIKRFELRTEQTLGGFSHGQRVKALLLLCLARRPRLLLLDEPTTGLDPVARVEVLEALADVLRDESRSVLFSSHNTHDVEQLADTITFLHKGRLVASADKLEFIESWRRVVCQGVLPPGLETWPEIASARANGSLVEIKARTWNDDLPARLAASGLQVQRTDPMALEDIFITAVRSGAVA
ncbi:ATP-binding cassette domain-containing protein [Arenimonas terrae]|uniref:ABC transporter ATP-binding protein n=1 Tax=Arenimonas terrae TaxID=2546226 RepID=A0A5C4RQ90_9GAMM|nr:ABC transporter ATP-binding protein [Arenimonas terrae]TNJ33218.1 ABC transporter ATP-binding protein [Arenimonas terrae]